MRHGIQGFLEKNIVDLGEKIRTDLDLELLKRTPSAFLGSCRYKLPDIKDNRELFDKILKFWMNMRYRRFSTSVETTLWIP